MLDNFVFKYHAQSNFARSLCLKRHSSNSILHEIFTVNGTNAVSNTAQHVWMYAWSLSYGQSEQRPKCFCPDYLSTVFSEKFMTPPHSKSKTKRNGLPSYDSLILVTTSPMSPLFAEGILGVRSFASKSSPAPTNWSSTGQVVSGPVMSLVVRSMVGQGKKI